MPVTIAIIGAGQRGGIYAEWCRQHPNDAQVVAVAEPRAWRLKTTSDANNVPDDMRFTAWEPLLAKGKIADAVAIAVLDDMHAEIVDKCAKLGYAILCEKPIATAIPDCLSLIESVEKAGVIFGCGHVLRYSPYNVAVKQVIDSGILGQIVNIQHLEPIGHQHMAHSYVRGNWKREAEATFSLMAKSCHDIDIINFYLSDGKKPRALTSFGSLAHFRPDKRPVKSQAKFCVDCSSEPSCPYSAQKIYLEPLKKSLKREDGGEVWAVHIVEAIPDLENVADAISPRPRGKGVRTEADGSGVWGKCVYESGNDVNDQQVVNIQYDDGTTAGFTMVAFTRSVCERQTRIHGSWGEIIGDMESFTVNDFRTGTSITHHPDSEGGGHGGGDAGLMRAFVKAVAHNDQSYLGVTPKDILRSHLMVFAAERARHEDQVVKYERFEAELAGLL